MNEIIGNLIDFVDWRDHFESFRDFLYIEEGEERHDVWADFRESFYNKLKEKKLQVKTQS